MPDFYIMQQPDGSWARFAAIDNGDGSMTPLIALPSQPFIAYRSGKRYGIEATGTASNVAVVGGAGGAANSPIYACPLIIHERVTITSLACVVGTPVVGVLAKLALYAAGTDRLPGARIAVANNEVDCNAAANTELLGTFLAPQTLASGLYWACFMANGAAQPFAFSASTANGGGVAALLGQDNAGGLVRTLAAAQVSRITSANQDYTVGFPAAFGTPTFGLGTPCTPYIGIVVQ